MPDEYVRVADLETGHHVSIHKQQFDANPGLWRELKGDATYANGTPLPPKYKTDVSTEATKAAAKSAEPQKEK